MFAGNADFLIIFLFCFWIRCKDCKAVFHQSCKSTDQPCPRCQRMKKYLQRDQQDWELQLFGEHSSFDAKKKKKTKVKLLHKRNLYVQFAHSDSNKKKRGIFQCRSSSTFALMKNCADGDAAKRYWTLNLLPLQIQPRKQKPGQVVLFFSLGRCFLNCHFYHMCSPC